MNSPIKPLAAQDHDPAFSEPWQAQVLALAHAACEKGLFTPSQWANALGAELREAHIGDERTAYYEAAVHALETLLKSQLSPDSIARREEQWRQAYLATPHGQPVEL